MTVQFVGWALIHSVWQGALIAIVFGLALSGLRKAPAAWRYVVCLVALVTMTVLPLLTSARTTAALPTTSIEATVETGAAAGGLADELTRLDERKLRGSSAPVGDDRRPRTTSWKPQLRVDALLPWLVLAWVMGVTLLSLRVLGGYARARRLVRVGTRAASAEIERAAARLAERLRVRAAVRVLESARAQVPMVIGLARPVVLMPASLLTGLSLAQIEAILAHELAHVRRYDYAVNLLQTVVETLFFYHPAVWWLSRRMREEREQACDELAVSICGGDPIFYSRVLLTVEEWRSERVSFAPAATGGTLALRIRKLIGQDEGKLDIGPRWFAGIVTVAAALVAAGALVSEKADARPSVVLEESGVQDTARARPASVLRYTGDGSAEARVRWAVESAAARRFDQYWVGYVVRGAALPNEWHFLDRGSPVRVGESLMSGHMRFSGDLHGVKFSGVDLPSVVGEYVATDYAVFLAFERDGRTARVTRVRLANFVFPMFFNRWPLLWLGDVPSGESINTLAGLDRQAADDKVRGDLPAVVGLHNDAAAAMPVLLRWLNDPGRTIRFRTEVVEAIAYQDSPEVLRTLARIARGNEDLSMRAEAVEALGDVRAAAAADTLIAFARSLNAERLRMEAVESLGDRPEPHVPAALEALSRAGDRGVRMEAVETLGDLPEERGLPILERLAESTDLATDVRIEALETISDLHQVDRALETILRVIRSEAEEKLQISATEALGNIDDPRVVELLTQLAESHEQLHVQIEATETLGELHAQESALTALERIAETHPQLSVRIEAVEAFAEAAEPRRVVAFAERLLDSDATMEVKMEALETVGELSGDSGAALLEKYARSSDRSLRAKAAELLEERKN